MTHPYDDAIEYFRSVDEFRARVFTGQEVLEIADYLGAGVGATLAAAQRADISRQLRPTEADYDDPPMP